MLIHLSFFFASLFIRAKFFTDGHYVGEEEDHSLEDHRLLAAAATSTAITGPISDGKVFNNEFILFDVFQITHICCFLIQGLVLYLKKNNPNSS